MHFLHLTVFPLPRRAQSAYFLARNSSPPRVLITYARAPEIRTRVDRAKEGERKALYSLVDRPSARFDTCTLARAWRSRYTCVFRQARIVYNCREKREIPPLIAGIALDFPARDRVARAHASSGDITTTLYHYSERSGGDSQQRVRAPRESAWCMTNLCSAAVEREWKKTDVDLSSNKENKR